MALMEHPSEASINQKVDIRLEKVAFLALPFDLALFK
jgi:hypothetical protein